LASSTFQALIAQLTFRTTTLTIDESSDVKGKIILYQVVVLEIDNPALLSKVERRYTTQE
jgi:hypothetical protein